MLTLTELAERMGIGPNGVKDVVRGGGLLALRTEEGVRVPAEQLDGELPVKHLGAVIRLLRDAGYSDEEALRWLTTPDELLPGTPLQALHENRATEIKRRAQALGF